MKQLKRAEVLAANFAFLALHPESDKFPNGAAHITDCADVNEFETRFMKEPDLLQREFGWDLPVWCDDDLVPIEEFTKGLKSYDIMDGVESMTYDEFVTKLKAYIERMPLA
jgi:hypothetical protein